MKKDYAGDGNCIAESTFL